MRTKMNTLSGKSIKELCPSYPIEAANLPDESDALMKNNPTYPRAKELSSWIKAMVNNHTRDKWKSYLDRFNFNIWQVIKKLTSKTTNTRYINIMFHMVLRRCANESNRQFTSRPASKYNNKGRILRSIHKQQTFYSDMFVEQMVSNPDDILKHQGLLVTLFMTQLVKLLSRRTCIIPNGWNLNALSPYWNSARPWKLVQTHHVTITYC